jgi:hypothetical protein
MVSIKPAFPPSWTPDEEVDKCARCDAHFGILNRKHHCRACGEIFCATCSGYTQSIPSYIHKAGGDTGPLRVCSGCHMVVSQKKQSKQWILIFSLLPLPIKELEALLYVNRDWNTAATCVISMFKAIQYRTGYRKWTGLERRILRTHWREFSGHSRLMVQCLKGLVGIESVSEMVRHFKCNAKSSTCQNLYCDTICHNKFTPYDLLELIYSHHTDRILECQEIESWVGTCLTQIHPNWIVKFIPWIVQMGKTLPAQRIITNNIIPLAANNIYIAYALYFECELVRETSTYFIAIQSRLMSVLDKKTREDIKASHQFLNILEFNDTHVRLPYDPCTIVHRVNHEGIKQIMSNTRPIVVPLDTSRGEIKILVKNDDLRKDRLVVTTMQILKTVDKRMTFHTYHVFPFSCNKGWVEMIPEAKTVYDINQTNTIQNYILSHNKELTTEQLRQKFLYSCSSNCLLGYMMGIGDRNLHNILVCAHTASIAHIDFSYVLGYDPKHIESTEMKITAGMVDMLGGTHSEEYELLKELCTDVYTNIRKHTYFWYTMFRYLALSNPPIYPHTGDLKALQKHIDARLMPLHSEEEMKLAIVKSVDSNSDSWNSSLSDMTHSIKTSLTGLIFHMEL